MDRIRTDVLPRPTPSAGPAPDAGIVDGGIASRPAGTSAAPDAPGTQSGPTPRANLDDELARLGDLLDRVDRDIRRSNAHPGTTGNYPSASATREAVPDALASHLHRARLGAPATSPKMEPPSAAERQKSVDAVVAKGFTNVQINAVPYFNQDDRPWRKYQYDRSPPVPGESRPLHSAGCAPTALAMIDCGLRNARVNPAMTARFAVEHGVSGAKAGAGTDTGGLARTWAREHGLSITEGTSVNQSKNVDALKAGLRTRGIALVSVGPERASGRGHFGETSHVIVVNGYATRNGEEWFSAADPGRRDQTKAARGLLTTDENVVQIDGALNGAGRVWISRTQLEAEMKRCFVLGAGNQS
jgi:hypothetical protein